MRSSSRLVLEGAWSERSVVTQMTSCIVHEHQKNFKLIIMTRWEASMNFSSLRCPPKQPQSYRSTLATGGNGHQLPYADIYASPTKFWALINPYVIKWSGDLWSGLVSNRFQTRHLSCKQFATVRNRTLQRIATRYNKVAKEIWSCNIWQQCNHARRSYSGDRL